MAPKVRAAKSTLVKVAKGCAAADAAEARDVAGAADAPPVIACTAPMAVVLKMINASQSIVQLQLDVGINRAFAIESAAATAIQFMTDRAPHLDLSADQKAEVRAAVDRLGLWGDEFKKPIFEAIDRLGGGVGTMRVPSPEKTTPLGAKGGKMQRLPYFEQMLTSAEWDGLKSSAMQCAKIEQVAHRAWTLGLTNPSEPTTFKIAAIICLVDGVTDKTHAEGVHTNVKKAIRKLALNPHPCHDTEYTIDYGTDPNDLPPKIKEFAYGANTQPVTTLLPGLDSVMGEAKMRGRGRGTKSPAGKEDSNVLTMLADLFKTATPSGTVLGTVVGGGGSGGGATAAVDSGGSGGGGGGGGSALNPAKTASTWVFKPTLPQHVDAVTAPKEVKRRRLVGKGPVTRDLVVRAKALVTARACGETGSTADVLDLTAQLAAARKQAKGDAIKAAGDAVKALAQQGRANIDGGGKGKGRGKGKGIGKSIGKSRGRGRGKVKRAGRGKVKRAAIAIPTLPPRRGIPKVATDGKPVEYNGGKIYFKNAVFRVIREAGNYYSERQISIARYESVQQAWLHALKAIDDY